MSGAVQAQRRFQGLVLDHALIGRALVAFMLLYAAAIWWLLFFDFLDPKPEESADGSRALNQIIWLGVFALSLGNWLMAPRSTRLDSFLPLFWPVVAYLALAILSIAWALAPDASLRRVIQQIMFVASMLFAIAVIEDRRKILEDLVFIFALVLLINLAAVTVRPPTPLGHAGIYGQKNVLGIIAALGVILGAGRIFTRNIRLMAASAFCIGAGMLLLVLSQSKTSFGLAVIAPAFAALLLILAHLLRAPLGLLAASAIGVLISGVFLLKEFFRIDRETLLTFLVGDPTFTGRTLIWDFVGRHIDQRFWLGHGYGSYWGIGPESPAIREGFSFIQLIFQAHNGYLDLMLELGIIGLVLVLLTAPIAIGALGRSQGWTLTDRVVMLALIIFVLLHNMMESSLLRSTSLIWVIYLTLLLMIASGRFMSHPKQGITAPIVKSKPKNL